MSERMWLDEQLEKARTERDEAIRQSQGYLKTARDCLDEIERLREALTKARPFVNMAVTQEQAEASYRWYSKAVAALSAVDAALKGAPQ